MPEYFVILSQGRRKPATIRVPATDAFEAVFFAWLQCDGCDRPLIRYCSRTNRYFVNGVVATVVESAPL